MRVAAVLLLLSRVAVADPPIGGNAMPGGLHVASAELLPAGRLAFSAVGGYGTHDYDAVNDPWSFPVGLHRTNASLAAAFGVTDLVSAAFTLAEHYDRRYGVDPSGEGNLNGQARVDVRTAVPLGPVMAGAQLGVFLASPTYIRGTSLDGRVVATWRRGPWSLSGEIGYRFDNTSRGLHEQPDMLRDAQVDYLELGVSEHDAVFTGAHAEVAGRRAYASADLALVAFEGGAPASHAPLVHGSTILRGTLTAGARLARSVAVFVWLDRTFVQPGIDMAFAGAPPSLAAYETRLAGGVGVAATFDLHRR